MSSRIPAGADPRIAPQMGDEVKIRKVVPPNTAFLTTRRPDTGELMIWPLEVTRNRITVGRVEPNDIVIDWDPKVSAEHCTLQARTLSWVVEDHSTNGSYINEVKVAGPRSLGDEDAFRVGDTLLRVRDPRQRRRGGTVVDGIPANLVIAGQQRNVLRELARPIRVDDQALPASNPQIAQALSISVAAVKRNLTQLFDRFNIDDDDKAAGVKRMLLARAALERGVLTGEDFGNG